MIVLTPEQAQLYSHLTATYLVGEYLPTAGALGEFMGCSPWAVCNNLLMLHRYHLVERQGVHHGKTWIYWLVDSHASYEIRRVEPCFDGVVRTHEQALKYGY